MISRSNLLHDRSRNNSSLSKTKRQKLLIQSLFLWVLICQEKFKKKKKTQSFHDYVIIIFKFGLDLNRNWKFRLNQCLLLMPLGLVGTIPLEFSFFHSKSLDSTKEMLLVGGGYDVSWIGNKDDDVNRIETEAVMELKEMRRWSTMVVVGRASNNRMEDKGWR